jgi:uncharacterized iron-regulated membrane protein
MRYKHMVIYVGRSSVFTDRRFTDKLHNTLHTHEEHGWELVSTTARSGPLGDVSGIWLFFKRPCEAEATAPEVDNLPTSIQERAA